MTLKSTWILIWQSNIYHWNPFSKFIWYFTWNRFNNQAFYKRPSLSLSHLANSGRFNAQEVGGKKSLSDILGNKFTKDIYIKYSYWNENRKIISSHFGQPVLPIYLYCVSHYIIVQGGYFYEYDKMYIFVQSSELDLSNMFTFFKPDDGSRSSFWKVI
jgi:hypothetical protein